MEEAETTIEALRPGAVFVTRDGIYAAKSEYRKNTGQCECILLESGKYAYFALGNQTPVREIDVAEEKPVSPFASEEALRAFIRAEVRKALADEIRNVRLHMRTKP